MTSSSSFGPSPPPPSPEPPGARRRAAFRPDLKLLVLAAGLLVATLAVLGLESGRRSGDDLQTVRQFQRMAGGLGLGATVRPRWCFVNFDPRIEHCTCAEQPVPGGYCYCPEHTGTVSYFAAAGDNPQ
jgi:hypothetical protein